VAKPRVFISSTFYDLKQVREDLERFIKDLGYESIRNETGNIPYGKEEPLEASAMKELSLCDLFVSIIGGRYGTESKQRDGYSISQAEVKTALEKDIPVFIFIDRNVYAEHEVYKLNKGKEVAYSHANNVKIHQFIEFILALPNNNPVFPFETSAGIIETLRLQWAGLYHRSLQDQKRKRELDVLKQMEGVASTLQNMVNFLKEDKQDKDEALKNILMANHPAFRRVASILEVPFRTYFSNFAELDALLQYFGWTEMDSQRVHEGMYNWCDRECDNLILCPFNLFDDQGNLRIFAGEWSDDLIRYETYAPPPPPRRTANYARTAPPRRGSNGYGRATRPSAPDPGADDDIPF